MEEHSFVDRNQFTEDILKMLERGSTNDIKIKLRDGEIVANKDILMARSEYFATMLSHNMFVEGETGSVDMSHCSKLVMETIIKFLFSGEVTFDEMSLAHHLELIHMTDLMLLTEFKDKVEDFVVRRLKAFMGWLSKNEVTEEQKKEIVESFNLKEFSAEELLRDSGVFSAKKIYESERLLELFDNLFGV